MTVTETNAAIEAVIRIESARLIAGLARHTGDVGLAEELAQDAVVAALEQWPDSGVPRNAGAWLMTVAKRAGDRPVPAERAPPRPVRRDRAGPRHRRSSRPSRFRPCRLRRHRRRPAATVFTACHPVLAVPARVALTLRLLGGLTTVEIARAYLVPEATMAQRIVRAKKTLAKAQVPFEVPEASERPARLSSVLEVIYLIFNEGYAATAGEDWVRPALCADALRLGRILAQIAATEPEVNGLVALMEIQASRLSAEPTSRGSRSCCSTRTGPSGTGSSSTAGWRR